VSKHPEKIVFYDGDCGFCNRTVQFVLKNDRHRDIYFSAIQSAFAQKFFLENGIVTPDLSTFYFFDNRKVYRRSSAALKLAGHLKYPKPLLKVFWMVPRFVRDGVYDMIAKRRHRLMKGYCVVPEESKKKYFLD
jgi:predicted DCC family thiol-disulfide oxidoreductase YuxK